MTEGVAWQSWVPTVLALLGWLGTGVAFVYRRGSSERSIDATTEQLRKDHDALAKTVDQYGIAFNAGLREVRDRMAEHWTDNARTYATKQELIALEERTVRGLDRMSAQLDGISARLGQIGDSVVKALLERGT